MVEEGEKSCGRVRETEVAVAVGGRGSRVREGLEELCQGWKRRRYGRLVSQGRRYDRVGRDGDSRDRLGEVWQGRERRWYGRGWRVMTGAEEV